MLCNTGIEETSVRRRSGASPGFAAACALGFIAFFVVVVLAVPARAADPIYPTGSPIGLVPPTGMLPSKTFSGFEDPDKKAAMLLTSLPASAYAEIEKTAVSDLLQKQGITLEKREPIDLSFAKGLLIVGTQQAENLTFRKWLLVAPSEKFTALVSVQVAQPDDTYSDAVVRAALATLSVRANVPDAEKLSLLPFTIGDLGGFHIVGLVPGRAVLLSDDSETGANAHLLIAALQGGPDENANRGDFARLAFDQIGGIKDVRITMSEPLRLGGQQGYQTMAQAKDAQSGDAVMVAQWLRFGSGGFLQITGIARADGWADALTRLRAVRDSVSPK